MHQTHQSAIDGTIHTRTSLLLQGTDVYSVACTQYGCQMETHVVGGPSANKGSLSRLYIRHYISTVAMQIIYKDCLPCRYPFKGST